MRVVVIGGGAGGMMAAGTAASQGHQVTLLEGNEKLGKKLYITGKGRCNITNATQVTEFLKNVINGEKFLMSAVSNFSPEDTISLCERYGCPIKIERGNRVFPLSDKSNDFIKVLERYMSEYGVKVHLSTKVRELIVKDSAVVGVKTFDGVCIDADNVIIATGGNSYPATGSTGDGYRMAKSVGHSIREIRPSLTPIDTLEDVSELAGVSLKNVSVTIFDRLGKCIASEFGEMLFTHTGVSGPIILSLSSRINRLELNTLTLSIDLKPAIDNKTLDSRILSDFAKYTNKELRNALGDLTISSLRPLIMSRSGILPDKKVHQISKAERGALVLAFKELSFKISKLGDISGAIVTAGGVDIKEVSPKDMQSKLIHGLHFAGEVLDLDALTGGYNIQIALSTGYAAGINI